MKKQSPDRLKIWGSQIKEKLIVGCWRKSFRKERENEKVKDESEETTIIHMRLYTTDNMSKDILGCWKNCQYYKVFQKMSWPQFTFEFLSLGHVNNVINNIIFNFYFFLREYHIDLNDHKIKILSFFSFTYLTKLIQKLDISSRSLTMLDQIIKGLKVYEKYRSNKSFS